MKYVLSYKFSNSVNFDKLGNFSSFFLNNIFKKKKKKKKKKNIYIYIYTYIFNNKHKLKKIYVYDLQSFNGTKR